MPMYGIGSITSIPGATQAVSDLLIAQFLPDKISWPLLHLRSNIGASSGLQYIGGPDQTQSLPVFAPLVQNLASEDYYFSFQSSLIFKVTRTHVLSKIEVQITFPDGSDANPILGDNSCIIFRIDLPPDIPAAIQQKDVKKEDKK